MSAPYEHAVLVCGAGSIGQRHIRNLRELGIQRIAAADPEPSQLQGVRELTAAAYPAVDSAIQEFHPDIVLVCSPPVTHVEQAARALRAGAHVFIEKPLSSTEQGVEELARLASESGKTIQLGYNFRFHPGIERLKQLLADGKIGRVLWARLEVGQYLPDWRPHRDYRDTYTAQRTMGGGIILDASHELDYLLWLLGLPRELVCMAGKVSQLEVDVEDCATILLRFPTGAQADVHMDFVQRNYSRSCKIAGELGTISWNYSRPEVCWQRAGAEQCEIMSFDFKPNDMYMAEMKDFLRCVEAAEKPRASLRDGIDTMKLALAALRSAEQRSWVTLG